MTLRKYPERPGDHHLPLLSERPWLYVGIGCIAMGIGVVMGTATVQLLRSKAPPMRCVDERVHQAIWVKHEALWAEHHRIEAELDACTKELTDYQDFFGRDVVGPARYIQKIRTMKIPPELRDEDR